MAFGNAARIAFRRLYHSRKKERVMGNRDARGREKKKPKKKEIKQANLPPRPAPSYTPPPAKPTSGPSS
jgi:hypothetical protein